MKKLILILFSMFNLVLVSQVNTKNKEENILLNHYKNFYNKNIVEQNFLKILNINKDSILNIPSLNNLDENLKLIKIDNDKIKLIENLNLINLKENDKIENYIIENSNNLNLNDTNKFTINNKLDRKYEMYICGKIKLSKNLITYIIMIKSIKINFNKNGNFIDKFNELKVEKISKENEILIGINSFKNIITSSFLIAINLNLAYYKENYNTKYNLFLNALTPLHVNNKFKLKQSISNNYTLKQFLSYNYSISDIVIIGTLSNNKRFLINFQIDHKSGFIKKINYNKKKLIKYDINNYIFNKDESNYGYHFLDNLNLNDSLFK